MCFLKGFVSFWVLMYVFICVCASAHRGRPRYCLLSIASSNIQRRLKINSLHFPSSLFYIYIHCEGGSVSQVSAVLVSFSSFCECPHKMSAVPVHQLHVPDKHWMSFSFLTLVETKDAAKCRVNIGHENNTGKAGQVCTLNTTCLLWSGRFLPLHTLQPYSNWTFINQLHRNMTPNECCK